MVEEASRGNWPVAEDEAGLEGEMAAETPMMTLTMNDRLRLAAAAAPVVAAVVVAAVVVMMRMMMMSCMMMLMMMRKSLCTLGHQKT